MVPDTEFQSIQDSGSVANAAYSKRQMHVKIVSHSYRDDIITERQRLIVATIIMQKAYAIR